MLAIEGVSSGNGLIRVLDDLDLTLAQGQVLAVIGPNGAGKSTLMGTFAGSLGITNGRIGFRGRDASALSAKDRAVCGMALCPEGRRIFTTLTIEENLRLGATPLCGRDTLGHRARRTLGFDHAFASFPITKDRHRAMGGPCRAVSRCWR